MDFFKRPIFLIILGAAVIVAAGWTYYDKRKNSKKTETQTATVTNLSNMTPADFDAAIKSELAVATSKALEAYKDNQLVSVEVNLDKNLSPDTINTRYIFASPSDTANNWMITISSSSGSYIRALVPKTDYAGVLTAIDTKMWKYNYVTALQLAEKSGGLNWRNNNTLTGAKLTLKNNTNNTLVWMIKYTSNNSDQTIQLDANSGKAVN